MYLEMSEVASIPPIILSSATEQGKFSPDVEVTDEESPLEPQIDKAPPAQVEEQRAETTDDDGTTAAFQQGPHSPPVHSPVWGLLSNYNIEKGGDQNEEENKDGDEAVESNNINNHNNVVVDLDSMKDAVYFLFPDKRMRLSRFWILLLLASIIATSGIVGDSAATVIGAMIVAPLMIPILGMMLSIVLSDIPNFLFSSMLVVTGVLSCIIIGLLYGLCINSEVISKENNSQMAARTLPKMSDLIAAFATGAVGSIALVRKDISGALPGVAISISLVPPLCVCGLSISAGEYVDSLNAFILFICNYLSILVTGIIIMYIYGVHRMAIRQRAKLKATIIGTLLIMLGLVAMILSFTSVRLQREAQTQQCLEDAVMTYTNGTDWTTNLVDVSFQRDVLTANIVIAGSPPFPTSEELPQEDIITNMCPNVDVLAITFVPIRKVPFDNDGDEDPAIDEVDLDEINR